MFSIADTNFLTVLWCILVSTWAGVTAFWLVAMQKALEILPPEKKMPPKNVWLAFIPFFGLYWQFEVVRVVADAMGKEYIRRGIIPREPRPGFHSGLSANIMTCCAVIPSFGILVALAGNITRLIHISKIKKYTSDLEKIMSVQMEMPVQNLQNDILQNVNPAQEEELKKNNPNRFMPPQTPEEIEKRWRKK
jgi:hypothetical protein